MMLRHCWGCRTTRSKTNREQNILESITVEHESCVSETNCGSSVILSNAEHEKFCVNLPGPSGKAKYS